MFPLTQAVGRGDSVTFCCKKPFKSRGNSSSRRSTAALSFFPARVRGVFFFPHHFRRLELKKKNGARGEFSTMSASALNSCAAAELLFSFNGLDCTVAILICHSVKNTSGPCSIKSPSKSPTLTAQQRTFKGSPLNGMRHSLTAPCPP